MVEVVVSARLYRRLVGARIRSDFTYRASFFLRVLSAALVTASAYVAIAALISKVGTLGGWGRWPITFLYGMSSSAFRFADAFIGGSIERCSEQVRTGKFDKFLTRPVNVLVSVLGEDFAFRRVGQFIAVVPFAVVALSHLPIHWTLGRVLFIPFMFVGAVGTFSAIFVVSGCLAFWSPNTTEIANAFTYGGATVAEYPVHIMTNWVRVLAVSVVPVGFTVYLPSFVLFDAPNPLGVPLWVSLISPLAAIPFGLLARTVWRYALRHYRSTGS